MQTESKLFFAPTIFQLNACSKRPTRGFTLVELMVTLLVAAILIAIAVPSFTYVTVSSQLSGAANDVVSALATARTSAIKLNTNVAVCANNTCSVTTNAGATTLRSGIAGISGSVQIQNVTSLIYNGQGLAHQNGATTLYSGPVADIFSNAIANNNHRCIYMAAGGSVLQTCSVTTNGACPNVVPNPCN